MKATIVGYGSAGARHARLLHARGVTVSVLDPADDRRAAAREDGFADGMLDGADLAVIASPNHLHRAQLEEALEAGCDVLVEKPIAVSSDGIAPLLKRAEVDGRIVAVGCNLRFVAAIEHLKALTDSGELGRPVRVRADFGYDLRRWRPGRELSTQYSARADEGGGVMLDAIHEFDYLFWIFGVVRRVSCFAGSRTSLGLDVEDVACALLDFVSGPIGELALDYASGVYRRGFELVAENGSATWRWPDSYVEIAVADSAPRQVPVDPPDSMYERLADDLLDAVAARRDPRTPGADGLAVLRIVEAARRSVETGTSVEVA